MTIESRLLAVLDVPAAYFDGLFQAEVSDAVEHFFEFLPIPNTRIEDADTINWYESDGIVHAAIWMVVLDARWKK